ncbi:MAG: AMP-binding protein, partial [Candidatus Hydrogenedentes bacterium]|nr:AMP-binding protein [Candidatus Hydrogenedentota bacterium]
ALQLLAQAAADSGLFPACLKEVITAGEQLRVTAPIRTFFARIAPCALVNQYGPTESHVVTSYTLDGAPDEWPLLPPIGRPIHNTSLYVLDSARRPVTIGVAGELYIGGAGLARGYHGRPELTRERFVANPFSEREGDRLYRTGDLVRYRSNGQIEFIGRIDDQVKVHGYRIELGEVESVLESHPQVRSAAADVRRNGKTDVRLAAYIVANGPQPPTIAELRGYLAQRVPRYMVPSSFTFVERLPLTPSGKVDRAALPEPAEQHAESHDAQDDPRTDIERRLADVWCKVLHVDDVGIHDNFFDLGGDSIGTIQLSSVAREAGLSVAPNQVFEYPTIAALAAAVAPETISAGSTSPLDTFDFSEMGTMIPIKPTGSRPPFFCVPGGGGVVFPFYNLIPFLDPEQPLYGLQDPSLDERGRIIDTVEELAAFHFAQMREIQPHGPYYIGGWSYGGIVAFEIAQMALRADEPVGMVAILDVLSPELMNARGGLRDRLARIRPRLAVLFRTFRGSFPYVRDGLYLLFNHTRTNGEGRGPALRDYFSWAWTDSLLQSFVKQAPIAQVAGANASLLKFKQPATRRVLHLLRINIQAIKKYDPKPYPGVLDVFRSRDDWADLKLDTFEDLGWGKLAEMGVLVHRLEGSHVTLMRKPYVDAFAKLLDARLRETQPPAAAPKRAARAEVESWYGEDGRRAPLAPATDGAARVTDVRAEVASA